MSPAGAVGSSIFAGLGTRSVAASAHAHLRPRLRGAPTGSSRHRPLAVRLRRRHFGGGRGVAGAAPAPKRALAEVGQDPALGLARVVEGRRRPPPAWCRSPVPLRRLRPRLRPPRRLRTPTFRAPSGPDKPRGSSSPRQLTPTMGSCPRRRRLPAGRRAHLSRPRAGTSPDAHEEALAIQGRAELVRGDGEKGVPLRDSPAR